MPLGLQRAETKDSGFSAKICISCGVRPLLFGYKTTFFAEVLFA